MDKSAIDAQSVEGITPWLSRATANSIAEYIYGCDSEKLSDLQRQLMAALDTFTTAEGSLSQHALGSLSEI